MRNRTARTDLPPDVWQALADEAARQGLTLAAYLRAVLTAHVQQIPRG